MRPRAVQHNLMGRGLETHALNENARARHGRQPQNTVRKHLRSTLRFLKTDCLPQDSAYQTTHVAVRVQGIIIGAYPNINLTGARNNTFHITSSWRAVACSVVHHLLAVKPAALAGSHQVVGQRTSSHNRQYDCY